MEISELETQYRKLVAFDEVFKNDVDELRYRLEDRELYIDMLQDLPEEELTDIERDLVADLSKLEEDRRVVEFVSTDEALDYRWDIMWNAIVEHVPVEEIKRRVELLSLSQQEHWEVALKESQDNWQAMLDFKINGVLNG